MNNTLLSTGQGKANTPWHENIIKVKIEKKGEIWIKPIQTGHKQGFRKHQKMFSRIHTSFFLWIKSNTVTTEFQIVSQTKRKNTGFVSSFKLLAQTSRWQVKEILSKKIPTFEFKRISRKWHVASELNAQLLENSTIGWMFWALQTSS